MCPDLKSIVQPQIDLPLEQVKFFCRKWKVKEFSLFGSVLTDAFHPDSDVDVLVVFEGNARWSLWDIVDMREELKALFGREVDLVEKRAMRNPFRKRHILKTHKVVYAGWHGQAPACPCFLRLDETHGQGSSRRRRDSLVHATPP